MIMYSFYAELKLELKISSSDVYKVFIFEKSIPFLGTHTWVLILQREKKNLSGTKVNSLVLVKCMPRGREKPNH